MHDVHTTTPRPRPRSFLLLLFLLTAPACESKTELGDGADSTDSADSTSDTEATQTSDTGTDESSADTDTDTGEPGACDFSGEPFFTCEVDADCEIVGDCCGCSAYNPAQGFVGDCGGICEQDKCAEWGFDQAACVDGECVVAGKSCNQDLVLCDALAPDCADGTLPQVEGNCWTGACLPVAACEWVPDCSYCDPDRVCVTKQSPSCLQHSCHPSYDECSEPSCACFGYVCEAPFDSCSASSEGVICE